MNQDTINSSVHTGSTQKNEKYIFTTDAKTLCYFTPIPIIIKKKHVEKKD
jgi:hypothetical protein